MKIKKYLRPFWHLMLFGVQRQKLIRISKKIDCIENGDYNILISNRSVIYKEEAADFVKKMDISETGKLKLMWEPKLKIKGRKKNPAFCGQILMLTVGNGCKIFDIKNNQVLSVLNETAKKQLGDIYHQFSNKVNTAYLYETKDGIVEKLIADIPYNRWEDELIEKNYMRILADQLNYLKHVPITERKTCQDIWNEVKSYGFEEMNEIGNRILHNITYDYNFPCVFLHRDVHFGNTLFDGEKLYYIDFEHACNEIFLYDIFNCIYVEFVFHHNTLLLSKYIQKNAHMLDCMEKIFDSVGIVFNRERYLDYFYIFLLVRLKFQCEGLEKNVKDKDKGKRISIQKRVFCEICDYLERQ